MSSNNLQKTDEMKQYEKKTGKKAIWGNKITNGFIIWQKKKNSYYRCKRRLKSKSKYKITNPNHPNFTKKAWIEKPFWNELKRRENIWFCKNDLHIKKGMYNVTYQEKVNKYYLDFGFPEIMWGVELDGKKWHLINNTQRKNDYKRERILQDNGWILMRFMGTEIIHNIVDVVDWVMHMIKKIYKLRGISINKSYEKSRYNPLIKDGFCIHCRNDIPFNDNNIQRIQKYCKKCIKFLAIHENGLPIESYCHQCGKNAKVNAEKALCKSCLSKIANFIKI